MKPSFTITVRQNGIDANIGEVLEEKDIIEFLSFDDSQIEDLLCSHAAHQAYWEALAVRLKNRYEEFESNYCKKWWAHNKIYARYVLASYGDTKPTVEAIKDMAILVYSEDATEVERDKFLAMAYDIYAAKKNANAVKGKDEFVAEMYRYIKADPPWYFETLMRTLNKLKEDSELVQVVAKKLDSRSFHIGGLLELVKAKKWNIGPMSVSAEKERELMNEISKYKQNTSKK